MLLPPCSLKNGPKDRVLQLCSLKDGPKDRVLQPCSLKNGPKDRVLLACSAEGQGECVWCVGDHVKEREGVSEMVLAHLCLESGCGTSGDGAVDPGSVE